MGYAYKINLINLNFKKKQNIDPTLKKPGSISDHQEKNGSGSDTRRKKTPDPAVKKDPDP